MRIFPKAIGLGLAGGAITVFLGTMLIAMTVGTDIARLDVNIAILLGSVAANVATGYWTARNAQSPKKS